MHEMSSLDSDNVIPSLVNLLSSLNEMRFSDSTPITPSANVDYLLEANESEEGKLFFNNSLITNSDPMLNSTNCVGSSDVDIRAWKEKPVDMWTKEDVLYWVYEESEKVELFLFNADMPNLCQLTGRELMQMTLADFIKKMSNDLFATQLYNALQAILKRNNTSNIESDVLTTLRLGSLNDSTNCHDNYMYNQYTNFDDMNSLSTNSEDSAMKSDIDSGVDSCSDSEQCFEGLQQNFNVETWAEYNVLYNANNKSSTTTDSNHSSFNNTNHDWSEWIASGDYSDEQQPEPSPDAESRLSGVNDSDNRLAMVSEDELKEEQPQAPVKKRGRPRSIRKKKPEKIGLLWEFLRDLLHNPTYNPSVICWDDYKIGKFKFVRSEKVAEMWGSKRENTLMTFDKFSRAMRYHYKSKMLLSVQKRLVYQFGENATGWRTPNPILA